MLAIVGILLSSLSTVVVVPYTTEEHYNYARLEDSFNQTLTIGPNSSQTFGPWHLELYSNASLLQISLTSSGKLNMKLYTNLDSPSIDEPTELLLQEELGEGFRGPGEYGNYWCIFYWMPPGPQGYDVRSPEHMEYELWSGGGLNPLSLVFTNPESFANKISFQIKIYFIKAIGERDVTNYRPVIDPQFFYAGISLVAVAVAFESALQIKNATNHRKE